MRQLFKKIKAVCHTCGTPLNGIDLLKKGDYYYCPSDFEKESSKEKNENKRINDNLKDYKKLYD